MSLGEKLQKQIDKASYPARIDVKKLMEQEDAKLSKRSISRGDDEYSTGKFSWSKRKSTVVPIMSPQLPRVMMTSPDGDDEKDLTEVLSISAPKYISEKNMESSIAPDVDKKLIDSVTEGYLGDRLREIAQQLRRRTSVIKEMITQPPTPSTGKSENDDEAPEPPPLKMSSQDNLLYEDPDEEIEEELVAGLQCQFKSIKKALTFPETLEPQHILNMVWLLLGCCCFLYNAWVIPLRWVFSQYQTKSNLKIWLSLDYFCDGVYLIDILLFKPRVQFLKNGCWVMEAKEIRINYFKSRRFLFDALSLTPLDILYLLLGPLSALRFPRLLKIAIFWEFFDRMDSAISKSYLVRLLRTTLYLVYTIHINAMVYYGFSKYEGIGSNSWVFQGEGNEYIRCFYFAIKTVVSIGKNPKPVNVHEQALMAFSWLAGVFVFAVLIGQVKDIVLNATKNQDDYRRMMDQTLAYLHKFNIPDETMGKVRLWFSYTWETQKTLDEIAPLRFLPIKLQVDLAMNVHIHTLCKVQLFQDCDENLLRDLVLKLKPVIFLPGDYVCKKGEVGKEMYIVKMGYVQVVGGPKGDTVFATLTEGSVFGEISLLALAGGNRRTADVKSHGFSSLFVLSKEDLQSTIVDHPEAQKVLKRKAAKLIRETKIREKESNVKEIPNPKVIRKDPKILSTIFSASSRGSIASLLLQKQAEAKSMSSSQSQLSLSLTDVSEKRLASVDELCLPPTEIEEILTVEIDVAKDEFQDIIDESDSKTNKTTDSHLDEIKEYVTSLIDLACERAIEENPLKQHINTSKSHIETNEETQRRIENETTRVPKKKYSIIQQDKKLPLPIFRQGVLYPSYYVKESELSLVESQEEEDGSFLSSKSDSNTATSVSINKRKGIIDLGSSIDSDIEEHDSSKAVYRDHFGHRVSLGSLTSSRGSFDLMDFTAKFPSTSSGSEINRPLSGSSSSLS